MSHNNSRDGELPSWPEVRGILDDPGVPLEKRQQLALQYFSNIYDDAESSAEKEMYGFGGESDFQAMRQKYQEKLGVADQEPEDDDDEDVMASYTEANDQRYANREAAQRQHEGDIKRSESELAKLNENASETEANVGNSNEILDLGNPALQELAWLDPVYDKALDVLGRDMKRLTQDEIFKRYDEQRDIRFDKLAASADELGKVAESVADAWGDQANRMATVFSNWTGSGKDSAQKSWQGMQAGKDTVAKALTDSSSAITRASAAVAGSCRRKVGWMLKCRTSAEFGKIPYYDLERLCYIAALGRNASDNDFRHFVPFMPADLATAINEETGDLEAHKKDYGQAWAKAWLGGFTDWFSKYLTDFELMCDNERTAVEDSWDALNQQLSDVPMDAFSQPAATGAAGGDTGQQAGGPPPTAGAPAGGAPPAGAPSAGTPSGGAMPGGGAPATPSVPPQPAPPQPAAASVPGSPDAAAAPAMNPVTGKPLEMDPATGEPYPIDPETGEAIKGAEVEPGALSVAQGQHELTMSEPDEAGEMTISVRDGDDEPLNFKLDFEPATDSAGGAPDPGGDGAAGEVYRPGDDGKIHIEQAGLAITAEQPEGAGGPTLVTVDDGSGQPTTYTLDGQGTEAAPGSDSLRGGAEQPADPVATASSVSEAGRAAAGAPDEPADVSTESSEAAPPTMAGSSVGAGADVGAEPAPLAVGAQSGSSLSAAETAGVGTAPGGGAAQPVAGSHGSSAGSMGGMGMMGGMGGAGGNASDQERTSSGFLHSDGLFDVTDSSNRISGTIGEVSEGNTSSRD